MRAVLQKNPLRLCLSVSSLAYRRCTVVSVPRLASLFLCKPIKSSTPATILHIHEKRPIGLLRKHKKMCRRLVWRPTSLATWPLNDFLCWHSVRYLLFFLNAILLMQQNILLPNYYSVVLLGNVSSYFRFIFPRVSRLNVTLSKCIVKDCLDQ